MFRAFSEKFPPVTSPDQAAMKLTTQEITEAFESFCPGLEFPEPGLPGFLAENGYSFLPVESNERITFYWLIGSVEP